ncbi:amino acid adenylation protein [Streptomyces venezuelae]|uniref:Amino acid adenylation protein n=2 Tax=Streptomyces venezuelae TaxID=54571 RepID=A0A5P2CBL3_STRVZ|nr:amino acid adenylation protein [Streptomyces venezuelae]
MMTNPTGHQELSLPYMLRAAVFAQPDRTAVSCGADRLTFRQLGERSGELAARLRHLGVTADEPVGIFLPPSVDLMVSVWGVLCAGAAYVPLSPEYPDERVRYMVADSRTRVVLTDAPLSDRMAALTPPDTRILTVTGDDGATGVLDPELVVRGDDLAYVIYTSGSTGRPKGIGIEHRGIVHQMRWLADEQGLDRTRTVLQKTPLSFDAAQWEILAPACGATVVMSEPGVYADPGGLVDLILANGVTTLQGVPTLLQALADTGRLADCTSLTQVFSGGEALTRSLATELLDALPGCELVNLYGPSECTINASSHRVDRHALRQSPEHVSIGRPVRGMRFHILDAERRPVPSGESGELYIAGPQLARGYLNNPELTADRFVPGSGAADATRLYRTGDLARWNADGTVQFLGRTDSQVKLRGFRVELDEIKVSVERHDWVKSATVLVRDDARTGANLVAFVELDPDRAALMDQGNHGAHHQSKQSKLQLKAQLGNLGVREDEGLPVVGLPGRAATAGQRRTVFARKTYRFYEGGPVTRDDLLTLLARPAQRAAAPRDPATLTRDELGSLLRYFGQFPSGERLLPKYGYASPGSLYATQLYLELSGIAGLEAGHYYYHPVDHHLTLIAPAPTPAATRAAPRMRVHFVGRRSAIEPVYRNNIREVLGFEAGHMIGLFDHVLPEYGLRVTARADEPGIKDVLRCPDEDLYLATYEIETAAAPAGPHPVDLYVQAHPGRITDLAEGHYKYRDGDLERVSDGLIRKQDVIAINQEVYARSSFGVTMIGRAAAPWQRYADLGRELQRLQLNGIGLGLMSSGYSSETGHPLASARRMTALLGVGTGDTASYFAVGGRISEEQRLSEGMKEDSVHMRGPAEILKENLAETLPPYMVPNRVTVLDSFPLTPNGKIDHQALRELDRAAVDDADAPVVPPRTPTEEAVAALWREVLRQERVSIRDDFFAVGGHSLTAVNLVGRINRELGSSLPLQVLFDAPTVAGLARLVDRTPTTALSRLVRLGGADDGRPVFCWPGLGGYPMSLRLLAGRLGLARPFLGVQAYGINPGERAYPTFEEMVAKDIELIRQAQPKGPYTLWGYSFGARVAFAVARQLEQAGERVDEVILMAPGKPPVEVRDGAPAEATVDFTDPAFVAILYSVFAGTIQRSAIAECLASTHDEESFIACLCDRFEQLDRELVRRIVGVVRLTFLFEYGPEDMAGHRVTAPVTVFRAAGDQDSFIDHGHGHGHPLTATPPRIHRLRADHYALLRAHGVDELVTALRDARLTRKVIPVPHVNIKHFPNNLEEAQISALVDAITSAVRTAFSVDEGVVSIALEPVAQDVWNERVYIPEIVEDPGHLIKSPDY